LYIFLKEKLLTQFKNILSVCNGRNFNYNIYNYCNSFTRLDYIPFLQKKIKNDRYKKLILEVFSPLSKSIVKINEMNKEDIPNLIFDVKVRELNYYNEGLKHIKKKIKDFENRYSNIESRVKEYSKNLNTENIKISNIVSNYFKEKGFDVTIDDHSIPVKENTVIIPNLLLKLKNLWYNNIQFNLGYEDNSNKLQINGKYIIAIVSKDNRQLIIKYIEDLKNNEIIYEKYKCLLTECNEIILESKDLSEDIKKLMIDI